MDPPHRAASGSRASGRVGASIVAPQDYDGLMQSEHTRGRSLARFELALGIGAVLLAFWFTTFDPMMSHPYIEPRPLGLADLIVPAGIVAMLAGLAWMFRIYRGLRDEPPRWRYRDR